VPGTTESAIHQLAQVQEFLTYFWKNEGTELSREDIMELDRKTRREVSRLAKEAQELWDEQRDVLSHARDVALHASRSAGDIAKNEVMPRAKDSYRENVAPMLHKLPWARLAPVPAKKSANPFVYVLMAVGAIAVAVIGYAAWQALRADDDLWVEENE
jgi:hypothetical protein